MQTTKIIATALALGILGTTMAADPQRVKLEGKGLLTANGRGVATLEGDGKFVVEGAGQLMIIAGPNDKLETSGFGNERVEGNKHFYTGGGKVTVTGNNLTIRLDGKIKSIRALGRGSATLIGSGEYEVGRISGQWSSAGCTISFTKN